MHTGCYVALMIAYIVAALAYGLLLFEASHAELKPEPAITEVVANSHSDATKS